MAIVRYSFDMGTRSTVFDDIDNTVTEGVSTVRFALRNKTYLIDLGPENQKKLEEALAPFIAVAVTGDAGEPKRDKVPVTEIRAWVATQPEKVRSLLKSDRGRLPKAVVEAYNAANGTAY